MNVSEGFQQVWILQTNLKGCIGDTLEQFCNMIAHFLEIVHFRTYQNCNFSLKVWRIFNFGHSAYKMSQKRYNSLGKL